MAYTILNDWYGFGEEIDKKIEAMLKEMCEDKEGFERMGKASSWCGECQENDWFLNGINIEEEDLEKYFGTSQEVEELKQDWDCNHITIAVYKCGHCGSFEVLVMEE